MQIDYYKVYVNYGKGYDYCCKTSPKNIDLKLDEIIKDEYKILAIGYDSKLDSVSDIKYRCNDKNYKPMKRGRRK
jgi:hypothetical protein